MISNIVTIAYHSSSHNDGHKVNATLGRLTQCHPSNVNIHAGRASAGWPTFNEYSMARGTVAKSKVESLVSDILGLLVGSPANTGRSFKE